MWGGGEMRLAQRTDQLHRDFNKTHTHRIKNKQTTLVFSSLWATRNKYNIHKWKQVQHSQVPLTGAVKLDRWKTELFGDVGVPDFGCIIQLQGRKNNISAIIIELMFRKTEA